MFNKILGTIIVARIPLHRNDLEQVLGISDEDDWTFNLIRDKLSSVTDLDDFIRLRHLSFVEFLVDPNRCRDSQFLIKPSEHSDPVLPMPGDHEQGSLIQHLLIANFILG
jgi:hypothetical protein